jgi:putative transcriptional regulator
MIATYAAGNLPKPFSLVVASHISLCTQCRAAVEAHQAVGGVVLDGTETVEISDTLKSDILGMLDTPFKPQPVFEKSGIYPAPIVEALKGKSPKWKSLGMGVKQHILSENDEGSARLLFIPPGQAVPDHSHNGLELTLVLQGSFSDEEGQFGIGDVEIGDEDLEHTPIAGAGDPCICLAATDAPLKFNAFLPRLLQPIFRI